MISMLFALVTVIVFALFLTALLHIRSKPAFIVGIYLFSYANIVLVSQVASLLKQLNLAFYLIAHLVLLILAWLIWSKSGKPSLMGPLNTRDFLFWKEPSSFKKNLDLYVFGLLVVLIYLVGGVEIVALPQNNYDSMTYHLSRVGYWLQHSSLFPWDTPNPRQTTFPMNAELGVLWTVLFWGTDQLSGYIQWSTVPILAVVIIGLARLLGASRHQSVFAALLWTSFPQILLQSITTMNDLVTTAFFASAVYLLLFGLFIKNRNCLLLSGLGMGLALGSKSTVIIALPGLGLALLLSFTFFGKKAVKNIFIWSLSSLVAFISIGAFSYVQNYIYYRNPFSVTQWTSGILSPRVTRWELLTENASLYTAQALDWTGMPTLIAEPLSQIQANVTNKIISIIGLESRPNLVDWQQNLNSILYSPPFVHEDYAWFGFLAFLLFIPIGLYHLVLGLRKRDFIRLSLLILILGFAITLSLMLGWSPYRGRYFTIVSVFYAPLLFILYQPGRKLVWLRWGMMTIAAIIMLQTLLLNRSKPLLGENTIWRKEALEARSLNNPTIQPVLEMVENSVPLTARLATKLGEDAWDYPLFAKNFERTLIQIDPLSIDLDPTWFEENSIDYILMEPKERPFLEIPAYLHLVDEVNGWTLFTPCPSEDCSTSPEMQERLLGTADDKKLLSMQPSLFGKVGVLALRPTAWGIEQVDGEGIYWLGEGYRQGLRGYLWSEDEREVTISIEVEPGPSKSTPERTLNFIFFRVRGFEYPQEEQFQGIRSFSSPTKLDFEVRLQRGLNEFRISSQDLADIRVLPNGDKRPLLILLRGITVHE